MTNNFSIDDTIIEKIVFGRIEPKIYAFETDTIPRYLKVGDTFRSVDERLNEWKKAGFSDLKHVGDWSSEIAGKDIYFRDYSVHSYLEDNGKTRLTRDVYPGKPYSKEFFKDASKEDVEQAIADIVDSSEKDYTKYIYYAIGNRATVETEYKRDSFDWEPRRPLQTDTIDKFNQAQANGRSNLLMYAVMRFGKSFTSLCCAKAMNAKSVLVVSGKADVADEWKKNVQKPGQFNNFKFLNSKELKKNDKAITDAQADGKCIVLFLTLQDLSKEKKRFSELFNSQIDLMIIDETHFGARAETLGKVIADAHYKEDTALKQIEKEDGINSEALGSLQVDKAEKELEKETKGLDVKVKLHLSGTPYRILLGSEFEKEDVISFCQYSDIISEKEKWYKENIAGGKQEETGKEEWDNPYYGFPQMVRFAFNLNESSMSKIKELEEQGYSYHLSALFAPQSIEKDNEGKYQKFEYENEVLDFLQSIDGTKNDRNVLSFLDNERIKEGKLCRHIVMVMPYCASCDAMEKLINDNKDALKNLSDYEIINISGLNSQYTKIQEVKSKIAICESEDKKTITLTVNRMLTGCTVPQWDTMIFLKDTASPQDYDQAIFRLQSQYVVEYEGKELVNGEEVKKVIKKDMKPQTLLVDFNPQRMFYLQETKSRINNINTADAGNDESEERIKRDLEVSPIIHISENKLVEVEPTDILKAVSEYSTNRGITEAANDIIVDENLINFENVKNVIDKEFEIGSGKGFAEQAYSGDETDLDDDDIHTGGETDETPDDHEAKQDDNTGTGETQEKETDVKVFVKKCRSYYRRILFYAFLSKGEKEIKNLNAVIESLSNAENERIFNNLGMNRDFVEFLKNNMSGAALRSLDNKIYDLYRLSHEYENSEDDPIKRATTAIQRFGKISDSEVVTPQRIAKEMVDLIPDDDFKKVFECGKKFLDIASKMGEFAVAIYRRAESLGISKEVIKNSIYSIPTSNIAYEFTRFVYEKLALNEENLAEKFNSYDLIGLIDENGKVDYESIAKFLKQNKSFNSITMNDEITEGDEIVNFDVVLGNPPYQLTGGSGGTNDAPIYQHFVEVAYEANPTFVSLIIPSKWFATGREHLLGDFRKKMLGDKSIKGMVSYSDSHEVFPDVAIKGGICYFLHDGKFTGNCAYKLIQNGTESLVSRKLDEFDILIQDPRLESIVRKVSQDIKDQDNTVASIISGDTPFGIPTNPKTSSKRAFPVYDTCDGSHDTMLFYLEKATRKISYIDKQQISKNSQDVEKYKVFLPKAYGAGDSFPHQIVGQPEYAPTNSVCSQTYLYAAFSSEIEAKNFITYLKTKMFRALVLASKTSQDLPSKTYRFVPILDFSKPWTDEELYAKYELTEEEIAFIESMIKPME
ncbi:MAG: Eco57I restriction-modification methylase domain-containing protein [Clostridia bacterium]|nr:Eco57I restriction-modification methylase domain-containing protein [Clostridia bacterium]MBR4051068.1 Eco57I restriction-modification methylase domain-containing protein [Clostridia bacterium]